jgi:hypothetical protein
MHIVLQRVTLSQEKSDTPFRRDSRRKYWNSQKWHLHGIIDPEDFSIETGGEVEDSFTDDSDLV